MHLARLSRFLLFALLLPCGLAAHADTVFTLSGSFVDGSQISGTLTINTLAGTITGSDIIISAPSSTIQSNVVAQGTGLFASEGFPTSYGVDDRNASSTEDFNFIFPVATLVGYTGDGNNTINFLDGFVGNTYNLTTSSPGPELGVPPAVTPEPSSFVLLGTGVLGVAGVLKRRLA